MVDKQRNDAALPKCTICGDTTPSGKALCWCCEHTPKLHRDINKSCEDSCEIHFAVNNKETEVAR